VRNDNDRTGNYRDEIQGSLHCAVHDETVNRFGRDDDSFLGGGREQATAKAETTAKRCGFFSRDAGSSPSTSSGQKEKLFCRYEVPSKTRG
jgi:hypothetical protein